MPTNHKLTKVIAGRTIKAAPAEPGGVLVLFDDQSNMKIKIAGPATIPPGGNVKSVHEAKAEFKINSEDGSSTSLRLADPGSSVAVRDKNNSVEYLGESLATSGSAGTPSFIVKQGGGREEWGIAEFDPDPAPTPEG